MEYETLSLVLRATCSALFEFIPGFFSDRALLGFSLVGEEARKLKSDVLSNTKFQLRIIGDSHGRPVVLDRSISSSRRSRSENTASSR